MTWFGGDPQTQEAYGGSTQPLQDAVARIQRANGQPQKDSNGGQAQR
mgnify:CR=1 FL=1